MNPFTIYDISLNSRLLIGSALYPSPEIMKAAIAASGSEVVTLSLRRQNPQQQGGQKIWSYIQSLGCHLLPNTAGCTNADEAYTLAQMSREICHTDWIKLEIIGDDYNLQPDPIELLRGAEMLIRDGFKVLPYCTDDLVLCQRLYDLGCSVIMPWGSPIGTGLGLMNLYNLETIRLRLEQATLIIDAGIGRPSDACQALEMGYDGVLLNSAVALADDPVLMASAFAQSIEAGANAFKAGVMPKRQTAQPSTPTLGTPFWHQEINI